jgi:RND family efflux transporter MFP subunit
MKRIVEAAAGIGLIFFAVSWLSGSCEDRTAPERVELGGEGVRPGEAAFAVEERVEASVEWAAGEVASSRHTSVSSRVLARIDEVRISAGSRVEAGDVLVVLDARDLRARVGEAEEALRSGRARLALAESEHARAQALYTRGVTAKREVDRVVSELDGARAEVRRLEEAREDARTALSFAQLRAPVSGRVVDRLAEPGDTAMPGTPLLQIYDPSVLQVEVPVRESLAVHLRVGQRLPVEVPALVASLDGVVDEIVPFAEPGARTLLVKVRLLDPDERLFAGMYARVSVPAGERRRLLIPSRAIEVIGQLAYVDVVGEGGARERRLVTAGRAEAGERTEVLSGLRAGEHVYALDLPADEQAEPEARERAATAVDTFRKQLAAALGRALAEGPGPAVDVCRSEAPRIAAGLSGDGIRVGRTSHRLRNPSNAPEPWMEPLLEELRQAAPKPGSSRSVKLGERGIGYVEPIYVQPPCLTCHGSGIDASLLAHIRERYPADQAVGFEVGDFRGLFWAVVAPSDAISASR